RPRSLFRNESPWPDRAAVRGRSRRGLSQALSVEPDVLVLERKPLDPAGGPGEPVRDLAGLAYSTLQGGDERLVLGRRQPLPLAAVPLLLREKAAVRVERHVRVEADVAIEALARQAQPLAQSRVGEALVPAVDAALAILDVGVAQDLVHRRPERDVLL